MLYKYFLVHYWKCLLWLLIKTILKLYKQVIMSRVILQTSQKHTIKKWKGMRMTIAAYPLCTIIEFVCKLLYNFLQSPSPISMAMWIINWKVQLITTNFFMYNIAFVIYYLLPHLMVAGFLGIYLWVCKSIINYQLVLKIYIG